MKKALRVSALAIVLISIFATMMVFASCDHTAWVNYSNSGKWASGTTNSASGMYVSARVSGTYRLANDYTSYIFNGQKVSGYGSAYSKWQYAYSGSTTFTLVDNNWNCSCGASGVA